MSDREVAGSGRSGPAQEAAVASRAVRTARQELWRRFRRNRPAMVGLILLLLEVLVAMVGPWVAPYDPVAQNGAVRLQGPSVSHWLGTDDLGRDMLSRLLHGAGLSLGSGLAVVLLGVVAGVPLGAVAAYFRRADPLVMRSAETMLALPGMLLALSLVAVMGPGLLSVLVGAGLAGVPATVLLTRSLVLVVREHDYVLAARACGCGDLRILLLHILPNCLSTLTVAQTFRVAVGLLTVSSLSFLGLGAQPPTPEWGAMVASGRDFLYRAPHVVAIPGLALGITVLAFNLLGDGLRDILDPRLTNT